MRFSTSCRTIFLRNIPSNAKKRIFPPSKAGKGKILMMPRLIEIIAINCKTYIQPTCIALAVKLNIPTGPTTASPTSPVVPVVKRLLIISQRAFRINLILFPTSTVAVHNDFGNDCLTFVIAIAPTPKGASSLSERVTSIFSTFDFFSTDKLTV